MDDQYSEIQPSDDTTASTAAKNKIEKRAEERQRQKRRNRDAYIRTLLKTCEKTLVDQYQVTVTTEECLQELATFIASHEALGDILAPGNDILRRQMQLRLRNVLEDRGDVADGTLEGVRLGPEKEFRTYVEACVALGVIDGYNDLTRYAPVQLETVRQSNVDDIEDAQVVGRVRLGAGDARSKEEARAVIPHDDCEHILIIAQPRQGKDSTGARLIGSLVDDHGYKAFSLYDDGRYETPMWAIPQDEDDLITIIEEQFGQVPKGYQTRVYVPATSSVPNELPTNFTPFTLSVADLTPEIVMRLASVTSASADTRRRLSIAIDETVEGDGSVEGLIQRIHDYAEESEVTISVTELLTDGEIEGSSTSTKEISYEMEEDEYLREIARSLSFLAGEGLIGDVGAESNIDLKEAFQRQDEIAVLSCNHLEHKNKHIKQIFINVWLLMIHSLRDDDSVRIPRAVLGLREINYIAPSQFTRMKYKKIGKSLLHTLYFLSKQGGSRGILMVGSTQKLNGVDKAIRQNMPIKIMLRLGGEEVKTLSDSVDFSHNGKYHEADWIQRCNPGEGMLSTQGDKIYPILWCPALCGLSNKDVNWKDRYHRAAGARIWEFDGYPEEHNVDRWIDLDGTRHPVAKRPGIDEPYLLPGDLEVDGETVDVETAMDARQEYEVPSDIRFEPSGMENIQTTTNIQNLDDKEAQEWQEAAEKWGVPKELQEWRNMPDETRENMLDILRVVSSNEVTKYKEISDRTGISISAISDYKGNTKQLGLCLKKTDDSLYVLTPVGEKALEANWQKVV